MGSGVREVAAVFLRLGVTAFGGPAAHVAMMDDEIVKRRQWVTRETFVDLLGATNLIPGPNSTELAIHLGYERAGWAGLITAGTCFIVPAMLIVMVCAFVYQHYGTVPSVGWLLTGVKPVILAIVAQALWNLGRTTLKTWAVALSAGAVAFGAWFGVNEVLLLAMAGAFVILAEHGRRIGGTTAALLPLWPAALSISPMAAEVTASAHPFTLMSLTLFFLKVGSVLYGSGYVLLAFLQSDLVERWHWLTTQQLLDAVAIGQFTPGPVFTTATFIGYIKGGVAGALLATLGIFVPAFLFVGFLQFLLPRMRRSPLLRSFLNGVNGASLGLMAVVTYQLGQTATTDWLSIALAVISLALLLRTRINSAWLVMGGALTGWLHWWLVPYL